MILREALIGARERLRAAGSDEADIEAEVLLRFALDLDRTSFLRLLNEPLSPAEAQAYERALYRRFQGEPTAYITGTREFHGLDFKVTPSVLIPRPETEMLVEAVVVWVSNRLARQESPAAVRAEAVEGRTSSLRIADIGTGSGAIAVSIAKTVPDAEVYATDLSPDAFAVARENARTHSVEQRISFRHGDLLEPLDTRVDVIVANLPYVTEGDWRALPREIRDYEPRLALASGDDGLDAIRALLQQAPHYLKPGGVVFLEFGIGQDNAIQKAARHCFPGAAIESYADFSGIPRMLVIG